MSEPYAFIGIDPETHVVDVIAVANEHTAEHLLDMDGLLVIVTQIDNARRVFGQHVPLQDVARTFALGKYVEGKPPAKVKGSGTG